MNFRARLSLFALEARETPSGIDPIDPYSTPTPPPSTDPATTAPSDPTADAEAAVTAGATTPPPPSNDPLTTNNSVTGTPLVP
jgi:hypothetical protein